ncbi:MAG: ATP-binding cassette domain-containing protein, partial [Tissierellia bacterium]|nr:ATP-binding cassette domain-containing protein [Tissierellia bacterium]
YTYPNGKRAIENFNGEFKMGEKYLIKGESGAGKSTLLKLIAGYLKGYEGSIYYDDENLEDISWPSLMEQIAYIGQDVYIFNETIKFNITLGKDVDQSLYEKAISVSELESFIQGKKEKDAFILDGGGENISGGERQRIAISRAIASGKKIWFIDEGLQGMDEKTREKVETNLLKEDVLLLMISHVSKEREKEYTDQITIGSI